MCLMVLALGQSARFPLVLASNRDEFFDRPTAPLGWWAPDGDPATDAAASDSRAGRVLAGRDLRAGGTWLGLNRAGRLALVTNVRAPDAPEGGPSRGRLVTGWLLDRGDWASHWRRVQQQRFERFNLVAADWATGAVWWAGSQGGAPQALGAGVHGLSNASLDAPWPKVVGLKARVSAALQCSAGAADGALDVLTARLFEALRDRAVAADAALPATGVPLPLERALSAAFIRTPDGRYGTRCSTVVVTERAGGRSTTHVIEHSHTPDTVSATVRHVRLDGWPPLA